MRCLQAPPRPDGEVMPTLDMALFDWTDYEDLRPEVWPSAKKKGMSADPATPLSGWGPRGAQPDLQVSRGGAWSGNGS